LEENIETVRGDTVLKIVDQGVRADQANMLSVYVATDICYLIKWVSFKKKSHTMKYKTSKRKVREISDDK